MMKNKEKIWKNGLKQTEVMTGIKTEENHLLSNWEALCELVDEYFDDSAQAVAYMDDAVRFGEFKPGKDSSSSSFVFLDEVKEKREKSAPVKFRIIEPDPRYIKKIRIFNQRMELLLWRRGENSFGMRLRIDKEDSGNYNFIEKFQQQDAFDAYQAVFGTDVAANVTDENNNPLMNISVLKEERVSPIPVFIPGLTAYEDKQHLCFVHTRNYVEYRNHQAGYEDCRFLEIVKRNDAESDWRGQNG